MPDKKLTDNEIVKALEYCSKQGITSECEKCKMQKNTCRTELIGYALDLINRLQAENELLQAKCEGVQEANAILREYNETTKAGAYKEFDELLKEDCLSYPLEKDDITMLVDVKSYNNLLKEMTGE